MLTPQTTKDEIFRMFSKRSEGMRHLQNPENELGQELADVMREEAWKLRRFFLEKDEEILSSIWECFGTTTRCPPLQEVYLDLVIFLVQTPTHKLQNAGLLEHFNTILYFIDQTIDLMHEQERAKEIVEIQVELAPIVVASMEKEEIRVHLQPAAAPVAPPRRRRSVAGEAEPLRVPKRELKQLKKDNRRWKKYWKPKHLGGLYGTLARADRQGRKDTPYGE